MHNHRQLGVRRPGPERVLIQAVGVRIRWSASSRHQKSGGLEVSDQVGCDSVVVQMVPRHRVERQIWRVRLISWLRIADTTRCADSDHLGEPLEPTLPPFALFRGLITFRLNTEDCRCAEWTGGAQCPESHESIPGSTSTETTKASRRTITSINSRHCLTISRAAANQAKQSDHELSN